MGLDLNALLVFSGVFGFGGALISLAISKWTAKQSDRRAGHRATCPCDGALGRVGYGLKRLFMSHPSLNELIAALREPSR